MVARPCPMRTPTAVRTAGFATEPLSKPGDRPVIIPGLAPGVSFRVVHES